MIIIFARWILYEECITICNSITERKKIPKDFFNRDYPNKRKDKDAEDEVRVDEAITKRMKKIAGIL